MSRIAIGVGDGRGGEHPPPKKKTSGKIFSGNYYVKFGHFDDFSYIFWGKNVVPP